MADNINITPGSGAVVGTETATVNSVPVQLQQVKPVVGGRDAYVGSQGGRLVDGTTDTAAVYVDARPNVKDTQVTPVISTSAYSAGFVIGGVMDFGSLARASGGPLLIVSATLMDAVGQNANIDLLLFNSNPTSGTYTDHATPTFNKADALLCRGVVPFGAYSNIGAGAICSVPNLGIEILLSGTQHLYGIMMARGTPTYTSTSALAMSLEIIAD